jgi:dynein light chain Tctex-type 1
MDDLQNSDEITFSTETAEVMIHEVIESVLKDKQYLEHMAQSWIDEICGKINKNLIELMKPFKYLVSCSVMHKNGAGLHFGHSCYWDSSNDTVIIAKYPNDKKKDSSSVQCIVTVFAIAY